MSLCGAFGYHVATHLFEQTADKSTSARNAEPIVTESYLHPGPDQHTIVKTLKHNPNSRASLEDPRQRRGYLRRSANAVLIHNN